MKKKYFYLLTIAVLIFSFSNQIYSQCTNCGSHYPSATQSTTYSTAVTVSTLMYGGDYATFNVTSVLAN